MGMQRALSLALLIAFVLFAGGAYAQRAGGMSHGGGTQASSASGHIGPGFTGPRQRGAIRGFFPGRAHFQRFQNPVNTVVLFPYWNEPFWYDESYVEPAVSAPAPPVVVVQPEKQEPAAREILPAAPKLIEVPMVATSAAKPQAPAVFILTNGQRLEARRYMLTAEHLYVTVDRQQRRFPLAMLDLNATMAANHERGTDLRIPADRNEISLGF
jgi:hypothetical protein